MTRTITAIAVLMIAATVSAISSGPGGRLYMTERAEDVLGDYYVSLKSYQLDANWDIVGPEAPMDHGLIMDNSDGYGGRKDNAGISPEIETSAGDGVGAKIVMGANYDQDPTSLYAGYETMDLVRITTSNGGHSLEVLGTGRVGHSGWYSPGDGFGHTDRGTFAAPAPAGGLLNAGEYLVTGHDYRSYLSVVTDANSDGDCTDSDEDYLTFTMNSVGFAEDFEIVGDKLWISNSYNMPDAGLPDGETCPRSDGIWYYQRQGDGTIADAKRFIWGDPTRADIGVDGVTPEGSAMVADVIDGHDAVWFVNQSQFGIWMPIEERRPAIYDLLLAVDLNDDGDAMDAGEISIIYSDGSASDVIGDNDPGDGWTDMELIEHDGTKFLLIQNTINLWSVGRQLLVMELLDNGEYVGGDDGIKQIFSTYQGDFELLREIEFDAVPEPGTLLLVASGALGVFGFIRRRRTG